MPAGLRRPLSQKMNKIKGHAWVEFLVQVAKRFGKNGCSFMAAAIAFYTFFSLFPFLLLVLTVLSYWTDPILIKEQIVMVAEFYLPEAGPLVQENVQRMLASRSQVGILAVGVLFWSSSGVFSALQTALNRIWEVPIRPSFLSRKIRDLAISASLVVMVALSVAANTVIKTLAVFVGDPLVDWTAHGLGLILPFLVTSLLFFLAYRLIPARTPSVTAGVLGAVVAGAGTEAIRAGFTWYVSSLSPYQLVYGSLGVIIAVMFWIYLTGASFLLGAQMAQTADNRDPVIPAHRG